MPPYLKLGSHPAEAAHRPTRTSLATATRASTTRKSSPRGLRPGVQHRLPPAAADAREARSSRPGTVPVETVEEPALRHHHLKTRRFPPAGDPVTGRVPLFTNTDVTLWRCRPAQPQAELFRNATADEIVFVHQRPRHAAHHVRPAAVQAVRLHRHPALHDLPTSSSTAGAAAGSAGHRIGRQRRIPAALSQPRRPDPARRPVLRTRPARPARARSRSTARQDVSVLIKDGSRLTATRWRTTRSTWSAGTACVYPFTFNADDFEPITGTVHQPPPVHQTFETRGFVVCTFAPRMLDTHPRSDQGALRPLERRDRRGAVLRPRPVRQPPRRRGGVVHAAPARHPARPAPRHHRRQPDDDPHRRTGRDGRHLPPAVRSRSRRWSWMIAKYPLSWLE